MAQVKFLSQKGLATLWERIRQIFSTKEEVAEVNSNITSSAEKLNMTISEEAEARVAADNDLSVRIEGNETSLTSLELDMANAKADLTSKIDALDTKTNEKIKSEVKTLNTKISNVQDEMAYQHGTIYNDEANARGAFSTAFQEVDGGVAILAIGAESNTSPYLTFYRTGTKTSSYSSNPQEIVQIGQEEGGCITSPYEYGGRIKSFFIDGSVLIIQPMAFLSMGLEEVNFAEHGVKQIRSKALGDNPFTSITLPYSLLSIGDYCFTNCSQLKYVTLNCQYPPDIGADIFQGCAALEAIYVPSFLVEEYKTAWPEYADLIQPKGENTGSQEEIDKVNARIDSEVATLDDTIKTLDAKVEILKSEIEDLKAMIGLDYTNVSEVGA